MAKLWQKGNIKETELTQKVERFTVGNDRTLDLLLAKHDVLGTIAHVKMLNKVNLLQTKEVQAVIPVFKSLLKDIIVTGKQIGRASCRERVYVLV